MYRKALIGTAAGLLVWGLYKLTTSEGAQRASQDDNLLYIEDYRGHGRRRRARPALEQARDAFDERMRDVIRAPKKAA